MFFRQQFAVFILRSKVVFHSVEGSGLDADSSINRFYFRPSSIETNSFIAPDAVTQRRRLFQNQFAEFFFLSAATNSVTSVPSRPFFIVTGVDITSSAPCSNASCRKCANTCGL